MGKPWTVLCQNWTCGPNGTNVSEGGWAPRWPPSHLPYGCLTKAIRQASWLPNMLALNHQVEGRTFLDSNLNHLQILNPKTLLFATHKITGGAHATFKDQENKDHALVSRLPFCFVRRFLKIEYNKFHARQLTAARVSSWDAPFYLLGLGKGGGNVSCIGCLYFADLWGLISAEFFNSWDDRDVHYPNGQHSLLIRAPLSHLICHPIVSHLHCSPYEGGIFFQVVES